MREIIFRGKRKDNGKWVEGSLLKQAGEHISKDEVTPIECWICGMRGETALIAPETVGQYTGLKDKNGTRIFEGDVIRIEFQQDFYIGEIYWADDFLGWVVKFLDGTTPETMELINFYNTKYVEVIGNIYDNSLEELQNGN